MAAELLGFLRKAYALEFAKAVEYRFNFVTQVVGMFVNDVFWIFLWFLLMESLGSLGGYSFADIVRLYAVITVSFGFVHIFFGNCRRLARLVEEGGLDYFLSLPKPVLLNAVLGLNVSAIGDLLFGLTLGAFVFSASDWLVFAAVIIPASLVMVGFFVLTQSFVFWFNRFESAARMMWEGFLTFSHYPFSVYEGFTRVFLLFVIPAGFVAGVPVDLMKSFSWAWLGLSWLVAAVTLSLAIFVFYSGLRRYESGSVLAMRA